MAVCSSPLNIAPNLTVRASICQPGAAPRGLRYDEAVDVEKTMQFILEQQAKFFAGMEEMRAREEMRLRQDKFDEQLAVLGKQLEQQNQINVALGKAMLGLTGHVDKLYATQAALTAAQAATDEKLNALIG